MESLVFLTLSRVIRADRQIHQAAKQRVIFPTSVMVACKVTNQSSSGGLSNKCQVQAHIALTKAGNIAIDKSRQAELPLTSL